MKLALASDIHLEFGDLVLENAQGADVLLLSGDIFVARDLIDHNQFGIALLGVGKSERIHNFFQNVCNQFKEVIYIMGNHEHYHADFATTYFHIIDKLGYLKNLHILEKDTVKFNDITFIGGTLWTDMNKEDPMTLHAVNGMMNDFRCVKNSGRMVHRNVPIYEYDEKGDVKLDQHGNMVKIGMKVKESPGLFSTSDAVEDHKKMMDYIRISVEGKHDEKFVVVGHHAPSSLSVHPKYKHDTLMNGGYMSDLSEFILDHPQIKLWTHGHTHKPFDYVLGDTRIVCNPRGYIGYEKRANEFELVYIDV